jgi:hypothetical protein
MPTSKNLLGIGLMGLYPHLVPTDHIFHYIITMALMYGSLINQRIPQSSRAWSFASAVPPHILLIIWEFNENDFFTFAVPNTAFGILGTLAQSAFLEQSPPSLPEVSSEDPRCYFPMYIVFF